MAVLYKSSDSLIFFMLLLISSSWLWRKVRCSFFISSILVWSLWIISLIYLHRFSARLLTIENDLWKQFQLLIFRFCTQWQYLHISCKWSSALVWNLVLRPLSSSLSYSVTQVECNFYENATIDMLHTGISQLIQWSSHRFSLWLWQSRYLKTVPRFLNGTTLWCIDWSERWSPTQVLHN